MAGAVRRKSFIAWKREVDRVFAMARLAKLESHFTLTWRPSEVDAEEEILQSELERPKSGVYCFSYTDAAEQTHEAECSYTDPGDAAERGGGFAALERSCARHVETSSAMLQREQGRNLELENRIDELLAEKRTLKEQVAKLMEEAEDSSLFDDTTARLILDIITQWLGKEELRSAVENFVAGIEKDPVVKRRVITKLPDALALLQSAMGGGAPDAEPDQQVQ